MIFSANGPLANRFSDSARTLSKVQEILVLPVPRPLRIMLISVRGFHNQKRSSRRR